MSWIDAVRHRLHVLFHGEGYATEQREELRVHLALEADHSGGGDAHARRKLGNATDTAESMRRAAGFGLGDRIRQDLTYALRGLRRAPGFTATIVVTLALGVGANSAMFAFLDRVFTRPPEGVRAPGAVRRLYIQAHDRDAPDKYYSYGSFTYQAFAAVRDVVGDSTEITAFTEPEAVRVGRSDGTARANASWIAPHYFELLGVRLTHGRTFGGDEDRIEAPTYVVILADAYWKRAFGQDSAIVGRDIEINRRPHTVVGITTPGFAGIDLNAADVFIPLNAYPDNRAWKRVVWYKDFHNGVNAIVRGTANEQALLVRAARAYNRQPKIDGFGFDTTSLIAAGPIVAARGPEARSQEVSIGTKVAAVSVVVLLIACANVANLLLVRATRRRREIAVRLAMGVSRARLVGQMVVESLVLSCLGGAAALVVAWWGAKALRALLLPGVQWASGPIDVRVLGFTTIIAVLTGLGAGLAPAWLARRYDVIGALKSGTRDGAFQRSRLRTGLVLAQTALSVVLIAGAGLFVRSLGNVRGIPTGYAVDSLVFVTLGFNEKMQKATELSAALDQVALRIQNEPGVVATTRGTAAPMRGWSSTSFALPDRDSLPLIDGRRAYPQMNSVASNYFDVVGTRILAGRTFERNERNAVIVNETMANAYWPGQSAIGKCVMIGGEKGGCVPIVGVVGHTHTFRLIEERSPLYYQPGSDGLTTLIVRVDPRRSAVIAERARSELQRLMPNAETADARRMREYIDRELRPWRLGASLFTAFGALALIIAAIGVYSVIAYSVSQRTHEMGVRMALGARVVDVITLVLRQGMRTVVAGIAVGIALSLALGQFVTSLLYGVTPRDSVVLASAAGVLLAAGVLAALVPAWRASRVDPMAVLRAE